MADVLVQFDKETWDKVPLVEQILMMEVAKEIVYTHEGVDLLFNPRVLENVTDIIENDRLNFERTGRKN